MLWGLMLPPGQPYSVTVEEEVQLSMIALESRGTYAGAGQAPVQITVHTGSAEYLLCTLVPGHLYQQVVDVKLSPKEKVVFCAHGSGLVHVTGYTKQCFQELFDAGYQEVEPHADDPVLEVIEEDHWQEMPTDIEPHQSVSPPPPKRSRLTPTRPTAKVTSLPQDENNMVIGSNRMTTLASIHDQSITSHSLSGTNTGQIDVSIKEESDSVEIVLPSSASHQTTPHFSESTLSFAALTPIRSTAISTPSTSTMPSIQHLVVPTEPSTSADNDMEYEVQVLEKSTFKYIKNGQQVNFQRNDTSIASSSSKVESQSNCSDSASNTMQDISFNVLESPVCSPAPGCLGGSVPFSPIAEPGISKENTISFDVLEILGRHTTGLRIINNINSKKFCSTQDRRFLVNLCVAHMMKTHGSNPDPCVKEAMAAAVIKAFPCLKDPQGNGHEAFFKRGGHRVPALGWLEGRLRYVRKSQRRKSKEIISIAPEVQLPIFNEEVEDIIDAETGTMIEWLKRNVEPQTTVESYMKKTASHRATFIRKGQKSLGAILNCYPRLLSPGMIEQDFQLMQPSAHTNLHQNWDQFSEGVIKYACQVCSSWAKVLNLGSDLTRYTAEEKNNLALYLLPVLFRGRHKIKGSCTMQDSVSSFIDFQPDMTNIEDYCQEISKEDHSRPFVVSLGQRKLTPQQSYVIIESKPLLQSSLITAIDYCFKCHYVFNLDYQNQCKGAWDFLQSEVFKLGLVHNGLLSAFRAFVAQTSYKP